MAQISAAYVVRIANGSQRLQTLGFAVIVIFPNIFTADAKRLGIHSAHTGNVRAANTNGVGLRVYLVANGLCTQIGMLIMDN